MKNFIFALCMICSVNAMADEIDVLEHDLDSFIKNKETIQGVSSKGETCKVTRFQGTVFVDNVSPRCAEFGPECSTRFSWIYRNARVLDYDAKYDSLFAVVTQKDSEIYSSRETYKLEIKRSGTSLSFRVSDRKRLFGGYGNVLDCTIKN